jgi:hypothetical protein
MTDDANALMALQNAWNGALAASDRLRELAPAVQSLTEASPMTALDFDTYGAVSLAHANAAQALRGLVEELRRRREAADQRT